MYIYLTYRFINYIITLFFFYNKTHLILYQKAKNTKQKPLAAFAFPSKSLQSMPFDFYSALLQQNI